MLTSEDIIFMLVIIWKVTRDGWWTVESDFRIYHFCVLVIIWKPALMQNSQLEIQHKANVKENEKT